MTNSNITLEIETGEPNNEGTLLSPMYWCDIEISLNDKSIKSSLQFDCGDCWSLADSGPDIDGVLEELGLSNVEGAEYEKLIEQIEKAIDDSCPAIDEKEIMEELFASEFKTKDNGVLHGYYNDTSIQVYELSDLSIKVAISSYLDCEASFISLANYDAYLKLLHSDKIWGDALNPAQFSITDRLNDYIEDNQ